MLLKFFSIRELKFRNVYGPHFGSYLFQFIFSKFPCFHPLIKALRRASYGISNFRFTNFSMHGRKLDFFLYCNNRSPTFYLLLYSIFRLIASFFQLVSRHTRFHSSKLSFINVITHIAEPCRTGIIRQDFIALAKPPVVGLLYTVFLFYGYITPC